MIGLMMLAAHMAGDFLFQTKWIAENKLKSWEARFVHCLIYVMCFIPVEWYAKHYMGVKDTFGLGFWLFTTHFIADSRRWASDEHWEHKPFFVDQTIHIITLAIIGGVYFTV